MADPFQRYRGLEIAADSPRAAALAEVRYHCVGDLALTERSTAAGFAGRAHAAIDACAAAGRPAIVTGGTGLYLRAALAELAFPAEAAPADRDWAERLAARDPDAAHAALRSRDPAAAARVDAANPRRLARKQLTWLRKEPGVVPLELGDAPAGDALPALLAIWRGAGEGPVTSGG